MYDNNVARLEKCLSGVLEKCHESGEDSEELSEEDIMTFWSTQRSVGIQRDFECPMTEILKYPRLLLDRKVNELFVMALNEMEAIEQQLDVPNKYPGVYLLLVHQNPKVCALDVHCTLICICNSKIHSCPVLPLPVRQNSRNPRTVVTRLHRTS